MPTPLVLLIGAAFGLLDGLGILFAKREPYKAEIIAAATLKGALVGLVTALSLTPGHSRMQGLALGLLYGIWAGLVVYLIKGGRRSGHPPYVIPASAVSGALAGLVIASWAYHAGPGIGVSP